MQELASLRGQLLEAESAAAAAVNEAAQLGQQLRSAQPGNQSQPADVALVSKQASSVLDQVMKQTYEALKDEFQSSVMYKVYLHTGYCACFAIVACLVSTVV